jgi:hypothetical protein
VTSDDIDVAAQLANVPDATSVTDTPRSNGRSSSGADTVLDPGLTVAAEPVEPPPVRSSSRSRRARQRSAAGAAAVAASVTPDSETDTPDTLTRGAVDEDVHTEVLPVTENADPVEDAGTDDAIVEDAVVGAVVEDAVVVDAGTDVAVEDAVEDAGTDVAVEDADVDAGTDAVEDADVEDTELLDTVAVPEIEQSMHTEVLPLIESEPRGLVETEILPEVEPRIYDVETDEPGAYVSLVPAVTEPAALPAHVEDEPEAPVVAVRRRRRPRVRRVTRVIRHIDTWTVFKVVLLFNIVLYAATLISGVLLWNVAHGTGTVGNVERFMESFGWETFEFNGQEIFDNGWRIGMFVALGLTGLAVLAATTFNLITDIVGGIRVTVLEEEVVVAAPEMPRKKSSGPPVDE